MANSCGACGKQMRYTQASLTCSGKGCKEMAHYTCVASAKQDWRCVSCCYPTEISVQYLLGEILKKGSGLELLQGLIGKINDLLSDINAIRDENESLKQEISLLTYKGINLPINSKRKSPKYKQKPVATIDLVSSEDETQQQQYLTVPNKTATVLEPVPKIVSVFVTWSNTTHSEAYLKQYLQNKIQLSYLECIRVSCYDTYSMFQIKVDEREAHLLTKTEVYPDGCKVEGYRR